MTIILEKCVYEWWAFSPYVQKQIFAPKSNKIDKTASSSSVGILLKFELKPELRYLFDTIIPLKTE